MAVTEDVGALLSVAAGLRGLATPAPSPDFQDRLYREIIALGPQDQSARGWSFARLWPARPATRARLVLRVACAAAAVIFALGSLAYASADSQPGDLLYPVRRAADATLESVPVIGTWWEKAKSPEVEPDAADDDGAGAGQRDDSRHVGAGEEPVAPAEAHALGAPTAVHRMNRPSLDSGPVRDSAGRATGGETDVAEGAAVLAEIIAPAMVPTDPPVLITQPVLAAPTPTANTVVAATQPDPDRGAVPGRPSDPEPAATAAPPATPTIAAATAIPAPATPEPPAAPPTVVLLTAAPPTATAGVVSPVTAVPPVPTVGVPVDQPCGGVIAGRVSDEAQVGVMGAEVVLFRGDEAEPELGPGAVAVSGPGGAYRIHGLCRGEYQLLAFDIVDEMLMRIGVPIDSLGRELPIILLEDAQIEVNFVLEPVESTPEQPGAGTITGTVLDEQGQPAAGVFVETASTEGFILATTTDARGEYRLDGLPEGAYTVAAMRADARGVYDGNGDGEPDRLIISEALRGYSAIDVTLKPVAGP